MPTLFSTLLRTGWAVGALGLLSLLPAQTAIAQDVLIRNATVHTITQGSREQTDVLVRNGRIAAVGSGLEAPAGFEVVDATGMHLMPGIIDAHSHIATSAVNEATNPVTSEIRIQDVIDPTDVSIYRALAGGVTISHVMHGSANAIGGQNATIKHRWGTLNPETLLMEGAPRTIKFALGENPIRVHGRGNNIRPGSRMGVEQVIREAFQEARRYQAQIDAARANPLLSPPTYSYRLETLNEILNGNIIVHAHSYRADEILMLMNVLRDEGVNRVVFQHVNEGYKVAPELAQFGAAASIFSDWWSFKFEVYYSTAYNAAILVRNGVNTSINSDSNELNRHLYHEAGKSQRYGNLTDEEALALITINPARQLGIEARVGSIEVGKDADLALYSAHPLSIYAVVQRTWVDGVERFNLARDADDQRLTVNPAESVQAVHLHEEEHDHARCMQGTWLWDFLNNRRSLTTETTSEDAR